MMEVEYTSSVLVLVSVIHMSECEWENLFSLVRKAINKLFHRFKICIYEIIKSVVNSRSGSCSLQNKCTVK